MRIHDPLSQIHPGNGALLHSVNIADHTPVLSQAKASAFLITSEHKAAMIIHKRRFGKLMPEIKGDIIILRRVFVDRRSSHHPRL